MDYQLKKINKSLLTGWVSIIVILLVAYSVEVIKGERTIGYIGIFAVVMLIPILITFYLYNKKKDMENLSYVIIFGYNIMYAFVMFTGSTQMVFSYILPMLSFLILYHKPKLVVITGALAFVINIISFAIQLSTNSITISNSKDVEIRFAVLIVTFVGSYVCARLYDGIHKENTLYNEELNKKNNELQDMAIQTIATIANTIDAKDEYTRGHSKRVSEYSASIAREMGLDNEDVNKIRSIALLHDIGKIGVPDAVLNKPGKLTDDEYELMKQHTVIGAEILKDIGMLPGIDIGAKHHHERYDGKGYPDKLKGDEIPEIARIIAVADAFDAMTSNRVYRKHLDMDRVLDELKKCSGTQFDPKMSGALIKMLEENRLTPISAENNQETDMSDVSKIWSRVIERDEKKFMDKSMYDELTGLYSRNFGEKLIKEAIENTKGTVIVADIDHFRRINGEAGFLLGDIFLRTVASVLDKIENTKILARYGGDEFVLFLPDLVDESSISEIADKLLEEIRQQNSQLNAEAFLTISLGIRICTGVKNVYQDMFLDADRALYMSKQSGGDCYRFYEKQENIEHGYSDKTNVDLIKLRDTIRNPENNSTYISESPEFHRAYDLIKNMLDETDRPIQLILFTLKPNDDINVSLEAQNTVMDYLEKAIARSIKGRDYTFKYSSTQRMIMLLDAGPDGAKAVSGHIMKDFYKSYAEKEINVSYSIIGLM